MSATIREQIEQEERQLLSPFAALASESQGRVTPIPDDPVRTCFMRDRDRILHSKSFRRLKHKTQVFIEPFGDHYRTRMTHSLEVAQIARTIGRALRLNQDLIEAIALGHDVGHTPFGHAGESALDEAIKELSSTEPNAPTGFRHYEHSLRVVDVLEHLNLSEEVRAGIGGHSKGRKDISDQDGQPISTLEAAVVRVADRIAYMNHDLDDAVRSGMIAEIPEPFERFGSGHSRRIGAMVEDVIRNSAEKPALRFSPDMLALLNELKEWLFVNVYLRYPELYPDIEKARRMVKELFHHYATPGNAPEGYVGIQGAVDYVAGMTDRFAMDDYARIFIPSGFR